MSLMILNFNTTLKVISYCIMREPDIRKKNPVYKNQGWEPIHQKYKANESTSRHNPKKQKTKASNKREI
jgi:hypothetical protein